MPTDPQNFAYPFDPSGQLSSNLITGEQQVLTAANFRDFHFVVPKLGPFFSDSLVISFRSIAGDVRVLTKGIDYYATHWFVSASRACALPVYGSITFLDLQLVGTLTLAYQTIGGPWVIDDAAIAQILADHLHNPRTTAWDTISNMPFAFPPVDHQWDLTDMVGMSGVVASINAIEAAVRQGQINGLAAHLADINNPHQTTAAEVGAYTKAESDANDAAIVVTVTAAIQAAIDNGTLGTATVDGTSEDELFFLENS